LSPSPEHVEYAETLLRLAESDLQACRILADASDIADGVVGFRAQQAVEKALKTAIVLAEANCLARTTSNGSANRPQPARRCPTSLPALIG
jgi:HEPN domain-containing protein